MADREREVVRAGDVGQVRVVAGVMTAVHSEWAPALGEALEAAMTQAVVAAIADGVSVHDREAIIRRKQIAYRAVMERFGA